MLALIHALEMPLVPPTELNFCIQPRVARTRSRQPLLQSCLLYPRKLLDLPGEQLRFNFKVASRIQLTVKAIGNPNIKPMTKEQTIRIVKSFIYAAIWRIRQIKPCSQQVTLTRDSGKFRRSDVKTPGRRTRALTFDKSRELKI